MHTTTVALAPGIDETASDRVTKICEELGIRLLSRQKVTDYMLERLRKAADLEHERCGKIYRQHQKDIGTHPWRAGTFVLCGIIAAIAAMKLHGILLPLFAVAMIFVCAIACVLNLAARDQKITTRTVPQYHAWQECVLEAYCGDLPENIAEVASRIRKRIPDAHFTVYVFGSDTFVSFVTAGLQFFPNHHATWGDGGDTGYFD